MLNLSYNIVACDFIRCECKLLNVNGLIMDVDAILEFVHINEKINCD